MSDLNPELQALLEYLKKGQDFVLPSYKELPSIDLYMEQVLKYVNNALADLTIEEGRQLTSFMVNNYVKAKMIPEPVKKKYSKDQIGYLIAITLMKSTMSMSDMSLLLEFESHVSEDKSKLYTFWSEFEAKILAEKTAEVAEKAKKIKGIYEFDRNKHPERADEVALDQLAFLALRLSIEAQANKLLSQALIATIRQASHGEDSKEESVPSKAEIKQQGIVNEKEAVRLAQSKNRRVKKEKSQRKKQAKKALE